MTTIALNNRWICWDSQTTIDDRRRHRLKRQKVEVIGRSIVAAAGDVVPLKDLHEWMTKGCKPKHLPPGDFIALLIDHHGVRAAATESPFLVEVSLPFAIGSGAPYALGALHANNDDILAAMEAAVALDIYSSGPIQKLDYTPFLVKKRRR